METHKKSNSILSKIIKRCFLFSIVGLCFACKSDDDEIIKENSINGFWSIADKGYIIEITDGQDVMYNVNTAGCSINSEDFDPEEILGLKLDQVSQNELIGTSDLFTSDMKLTRLDQIPTCLPDQISTTQDPKVNFDHFWNTFNDYYAFFELRNIDWSSYKNARDQVTEENLYDIIEEMVLLLEDGHVSVSDEKKGIEISSESLSILRRLNSGLSGDFVIKSAEDYDTLFNQKITTIVSKYLTGDVEIDKNNKIAWRTLNNDIAYINILGMEGFGTDANTELTALNTVLDTVMNMLEKSGVSKLIIDIRFNGGGYDMVSLNIASRFINQERIGFAKKARLGSGFTENKSIMVKPGGDFQFTGDIVLLTSPLTASAAEVFTLCLKDLSNVTIVGDNTNGAFSDILSHILPNGARVNLSNEIYSDVQGIVYEGVGIGPGNVVENKIPIFSNSDIMDEKDSAIDRAIELLQK